MTEENKGGRPTLYTPENAEKICELIEQGFSLRHIECEENMPEKTTIMRWCRKHPEFCKQYTRAKVRQAEAFAEEILDIVDDCRNDWVERETRNSSYIALNEEAVARSRMRMDARKWLMGKMKPKKYGDAVTTKHADANGDKIEFFTLNIDGDKADSISKAEALQEATGSDISQQTLRTD